MIDISVVVCVKNEAARIAESLARIRSAGPREIIVVDGNSEDDTVRIAQEYTDKIIVSQSGSLCADRQVGIDAATCDYIAMIDADHRLPEGALESLIRDLEHYQFDMVQSQLRMHGDGGFWCKGEDEMWQITHNHPGEKEMIGTAPAVYRKKMFEQIRFDPETTVSMDDTDFIYRLKRDTDCKVGIGDTVVYQKHFPSLGEYVKKFIWYGVGDGQFCVKHPNRAPGMLFHLLIRYPFIYSFKAIVSGKWHAGLYCFIQGFVRGFGLAKYIFSSRR